MGDPGLDGSHDKSDNVFLRSAKNVEFQGWMFEDLYTQKFGVYPLNEINEHVSPSFLNNLPKVLKAKNDIQILDKCGIRQFYTLHPPDFKFNKTKRAMYFAKPVGKWANSNSRGLSWPPRTTSQIQTKFFQQKPRWANECLKRDYPLQQYLQFPIVSFRELVVLNHILKSDNCYRFIVLGLLEAVEIDTVYHPCQLKLLIKRELFKFMSHKFDTLQQQSKRMHLKFIIPEVVKLINILFKDRVSVLEMDRVLLYICTKGQVLSTPAGFIVCIGVYFASGY